MWKSVRKWETRWAKGSMLNKELEIIRLREGEKVRERQRENAKTDKVKQREINMTTWGTWQWW